jgi:hypothetical protein
VIRIGVDGASAPINDDPLGSAARWPSRTADATAGEHANAKGRQIAQAGARPLRIVLARRDIGPGS